MMPQSEAETRAGTAATRTIRPPSEATRSVYRRDWAHFASWCRDQGIDPRELPAAPDRVAAYLLGLGRLGRSARAARLAAIAHEHRRRGLSWDAGHPALREALGSLRGADRAVRPAAVLTTAELGRLAEACGGDLAGLRDRALLLLGFAGALRRSELVALDHHHLHFTATGVTLEVVPSDNAEADAGRTLDLPRWRDAAGAPAALCPVRALEAWLARANLRYGAVFRGVSAKGRLGDRLGADAVHRILRARAALAGVKPPPGQRLSPHALRAGGRAWGEAAARDAGTPDP